MEDMSCKSMGETAVDCKILSFSDMFLAGRNTYTFLPTLTFLSQKKHHERYPDILKWDFRSVVTNAPRTFGSNIAGFSRLG